MNKPLKAYDDAASAGLDEKLELVKLELVKLELVKLELVNNILCHTIGCWSVPVSIKNMYI